jgi:hypothetical protein
MRDRCLSMCVVCVAALAVVGISVPSVSAAGYWNVPSSFCQCIGYGYGAGYHAPLVLGPITCHGYVNYNEVRLPCPPRPQYCGCGFEYGGCAGGCNSSLIEPSALPPMSVEPAPTELLPPIHP